MGFGQGLSGLNAASQNLDVIGNNIANSGTVGFKAGTATFADVYANSRVGLGVSVSGINQRFTIGTVSTTGNQFDIAVDGAKGLFRVVDTSGNVLYTRNGQFFPDKDNYVVNAQGQRLTGYADGGNTLVPIKVPVGNIAPQATSSIGMVANVNANSDVIPGTDVPETIGVVALTDTTPATVNYHYKIVAGDVVWTDAAGDPADPADFPPAGSYTTGTSGQAVTIGADGAPSTTAFAAGPDNIGYVAPVTAVAFDPDVPGSYTHQLPTTVYDSLGNAHQLTQYFVKREGTTGTDSSWEVHYRLDGEVVDTDPAGSAINMTFDSSGRLTSPTGPVTLGYAKPGGFNTPADPLQIAINYAGTTQFGGDFSASRLPNGYATGEYASMSIAADGAMVASYSNGETLQMGYLALADFNNLQGLQPVGGNAWAETSASGQPIVGRPGSNGLASIKGQSVEDSNVDMSQELVNMIIAQRTYQANAQTIKTQDQVLQTLINLR
ncbi:flagellar hook-basal body complex protein [Pollutimonas bauzanensis]|uniref:Flagellar hook protein FlgE n=1 Tax=Pollutimonas bauzanensis TaxID=658167 RepID=A0A1M5Z4L4_9BURK|nr:flagellar hook-basal body complex protein [Pollutimonas bauzanensis]SHI19206.1 flagellar hook protein FlgE [Pollutimonas bauzanensis]